MAMLDYAHEVVRLRQPKTVSVKTDLAGDVKMKRR